MCARLRASSDIPGLPTLSLPAAARLLAPDASKTVDITGGDKVLVDFTYSVKWAETSVPFERRMDKYAKYSFLPQHLEVGQGRPCRGAYLGPSAGAWGVVLAC